MDSSGQVCNPEPSVASSSKDLDTSPCHSDLSNVAPFADEVPDQSVCSSEVIDLTMDGSPAVDCLDRAIKHVTTSSSKKQPKQTSFSSTPRDGKQKFSRKRSFEQTSDDKNRVEPSKGGPNDPSYKVSQVGPDFDVYASLPITCPVVIELIAGSGRVTAQLKHVGVKSAFGVDHKNLSKIAPIQVCDLSTPEGQKLCMQWCQSPLLAGLFAAPPCGTCSRARSIILRDSKGRPLPGPGSDSHPNGLPFLKPADRARVSSANRLYDFLSRLVQKLVLRGIPIVIENPRNSLYWLTSFFQVIKFTVTCDSFLFLCQN